MSDLSVIGPASATRFLAVRSPEVVIANGGDLEASPLASTIVAVPLRHLA